MSDLVVITRPSEDAYDYAGELAREGFKCFVEPMLEIERQAFEINALSRYQALLFTSANAVRIFCDAAFNLEGVRAEDVRAMPLFVVGKYTAKIAAEKGFKHIKDAKGTGDDLVALVASEATDTATPLLHVRGKHIARPLDVLLAQVGIQLDPLIVYEAVRAQGLSDDFTALLDDQVPMAAVFYSKRTVETFIELARRAGRLDKLLSTKALCVSEAVLKYVQPYNWAGTYASDVPNRDGMLALLQAVSGAASDETVDIK